MATFADERNNTVLGHVSNFPENDLTLWKDGGRWLGCWIVGLLGRKNLLTKPPNHQTTKPPRPPSILPLTVRSNKSSCNVGSIPTLTTYRYQPDFNGITLQGEVGSRRKWRRSESEMNTRNGYVRHKWHGSWKRLGCRKPRKKETGEFISTP